MHTSNRLLLFCERLVVREAHCGVKICFRRTIKSLFASRLFTFHFLNFFYHFLVALHIHNLWWTVASCIGGFAWTHWRWRISTIDFLIPIKLTIVTPLKPPFRRYYVHQLDPSAFYLTFYVQLSGCFWLFKTTQRLKSTGISARHSNWIFILKTFQSSEVPLSQLSRNELFNDFSLAAWRCVATEISTSIIRLKRLV